MQSLVYSFLAGSTTVFGAIFLIFFRSPGKRVMALFLGFAGGIMIAISLFELLPDSLEIALESSGYTAAMITVFTGFLLGCALMLTLDLLLPHAHLSSDDNLVIENEDKTPSFEKTMLRTGYLIFFGIALHNVPEGIAIGAGIEASASIGLYIAIAIGLHNIPEGLAVAGPLRAGGMPIIKIILFTLGAGLMTVVGTGIGLLISGISASFVAGSLAFAAGAMVYIVNDELIPQSNSFHSHFANAGLIAGLLTGFVIL